MTSTHPAAALVDRLQSILDRNLAEPTASSTHPALVDLPNHNNSGDSAIWLGELAFFRRRGTTPGYVCDTASYSPRDLEGRAPSGHIFLHGGGNFGDLWPAHQALRERLLRDFPHRDVVQLPQTVTFQDRANLDRLVAVVGKRSGSFTVHCRDRPSLQLLSDAGLDVRLTPDMAFALGTLLPPQPPSHDVVVVRRLDHERTDEELRVPACWSVRSTDWLDVHDIRFRRRITTRSREGLRWLARRSTGDGVVPTQVRLLPVLFHERLARARVDRALRILSSGRVVVTDRLHGHILALLLGPPHILLPDRHDKVRRFHHAFSARSPLTTMLDRSADLVPHLNRMRRATPSSQPAGGLT